MRITNSRARSLRQQPSLVFGVPTTRATERVRMRTARGIGAGFALAVAACSGDSTAPSACYATAGTPASGAGIVTIDPRSHFQTMQGFGTTERLFDDPHVTETFDQATRR